MIVGENMNFLVLAVTALLSLPSLAESKKAHRHHDAHVHGAAELSMAFDQLNGKIEFKAASEGVLGFEHQPQTEKEKKALQETVDLFEKNISSWIQLDSSLGCVWTKENIGMISEKSDKANSEKSGKKHQGEHSNFVANMNVVCKKDIQKSKVTFDFKQLKRLKDIDVTVLVGEFQKSFEIKGRAVTIELK